MSVNRDLGLGLNRLSEHEHGRLVAYINLKLAGLGLPVYSQDGTSFLDLASDMLANYRERGRLLADYLPPADARIQGFLDAYLADLPQ
ncbi:MAG TPA: hypothetical protein PLC54_08860, partial [Spirochaetales bacterium]|nr:hypothetical protein [Spirochaetales bacterium]